jgi:lipopolysaccharide export LptBFGC system permease protein LptF
MQLSIFSDPNHLPPYKTVKNLPRKIDTYQRTNTEQRNGSNHFRHLCCHIYAVVHFLLFVCCFFALPFFSLHSAYCRLYSYFNMVVVVLPFFIVMGARNGNKIRNINERFLLDSFCSLGRHRYTSRSHRLFRVVSRRCR